MTIAHSTAARNAIADLIDSLINTGAAVSKLRVRDGSTTIIDFNFADPAFGAASGGIITLNGTPIATQALADGPSVDNFQLLDQDGTLVISGSVTAVGGGGDIEITNINVALDQDCSLDSLTYAAAA